jgi:hypothetical protein
LSPVKCVKAIAVVLIIAVVVTPAWGHVGNAERCPSPA